MQSSTQTASNLNKRLWAGRVISALPTLFLLLDSVGKLVKPAPVVEGTIRLGYPESVIVGALIWGGLYLRDGRLRALIPLRLPLLQGLLVIAVAGLSANPSFSQKAEKEAAASAAPTILFVCEHGAAKSVIAAAYFDKLARERGLKYKAVFRGTNPDLALSPVTEKGLKEDGLNTSGWKPELVSRKDLDTASRIITLGCTLPDADKVAAKMTDWNAIPSPSQNYRLARDEIRQRVQRLVDELATKEMSMTMRASGTFEVKLTPQDDQTNDKSKDKSGDQKVGATLGRMTIDKQFHGDLVAVSQGQMLSAVTAVQGSAGYVAIEKISGTLHGRRGSFVLQHSGTMTRGAPELTVTVVPDSGTDQLAGLAGRMTIKIADGKHFYDFEYTLAKTP